MKRLKYIFCESDISLACLMLGVGLVLWGVLAVIMAPQDFMTFSRDMTFGTTWFWLLNYELAGAGFVLVAYLNMPARACLFVGTHACLVWSWIAMIRGFSNVTSGITLNVIVIVMGFLLLQRSQVKR